MKQTLIDKIAAEMNPIPDINLEGTPANDQEIYDAEKRLGIKFCHDYVVFIKTFGGACAGVPVYAFNNNGMMGNETVVSLTEMFRSDYADDARGVILNKGYAISIDGSGNPILIDADGRVLIFYHDNDEYEVFANSFAEFIEGAIDDKYENKW